MSRHFEPIPSATSSDPSRPESSTLGKCGHVVLFVVGFVGVTALLMAPHSEDDILRAKRSYLAKHAGEFEGVFFGSSRVHRAFDPVTFEEVTGELGEPVRVFNFGLLYGRPHELDTLVEETLRRHRFRYVFVELMDWAPSLNRDLEDQDRTLAWHTPRQTWSAIGTCWRTEGSTIGKLWTTGKHVGHLVKRTVNLGGGPIRVRAWFGDGGRHQRWREAVAADRGWIRYETETDPRYARERTVFLEKYVHDYRQQISTVDLENARPGSLVHFNVAALRAQAAIIRGFGAEPIYVIPNLRRGTPGWHRLDDEGAVETLFTFNHVTRYPELYAVEHHFDRRHLNTEGARHFSRLLAERFDEWRRRAVAESRGVNSGIAHD